jgi:curved DNA-binding protein
MDPTHYDTLGLGRDCNREQIRNAYRRLAKASHPDVNRTPEATPLRIQAVNLAYEILSDPARRRAYDRELDDSSRAAATKRGGRLVRNISKEVRLRLEDFLRGTSVEVQVNDPGNEDGAESYQLSIPPETAPGARFRLPRTGAAKGGFVALRLKALPGFRFKVRRSDLQCDLRISAERAERGGTEMIERPRGGMLRVTIPPRVKRGEVIRIPNEGMPKPRAGRGDLLVRITYRPDVRVTRSR